MTESVADGLSRHQIARAEIEAWRGRCLDCYARVEHAVGIALEEAKLRDPSIKLAHLAGQRMDQLAKLADRETATKKQQDALKAALESWRGVEDRRFFLAHGRVSELLDRHGDWHVQFDATIYKTKKAQSARLNLSKLEALTLEERLQTLFKQLSSQLGQFRKRLST